MNTLKQFFVADLLGFGLQPSAAIIHLNVAAVSLPAALPMFLLSVSLLAGFVRRCRGL